MRMPFAGPANTISTMTFTTTVTFNAGATKDYNNHANMIQVVKPIKSLFEGFDVVNNNNNRSSSSSDHNYSYKLHNKSLPPPAPSVKPINSACFLSSTPFFSLMPSMELDYVFPSKSFQADWVAASANWTAHQPGGEFSTLPQPPFFSINRTGHLSTDRTLPLPFNNHNISQNQNIAPVAASHTVPINHNHNNGNNNAADVAAYAVPVNHVNANTGAASFLLSFEANNNNKAMANVEKSSPKKYRAPKFVESLNILNVLGGGTYGKVYKCEDPLNNGRLVAVKKQKWTTTSAKEVRVNRLIQESSLVCHPNVVPLIETRNSSKEQPNNTNGPNGTPIPRHCYMVFELGLCNLWTFVSSPARLAVVTHAVRLRFAVEILRGLEHIHNCGIIHGDLSPNNVMVFDPFVAKISDFGGAHIMHKVTRRALVRNDTLCVTTQYRAPELSMPSQVRSSNGASMTSFDETVDIWAFGCILLDLFEIKAFQRSVYDYKGDQYKQDEDQLNLVKGWFAEPVLSVTPTQETAVPGGCEIRIKVEGEEGEGVEGQKRHNFSTKSKIHDLIDKNRHNIPKPVYDWFYDIFLGPGIANKRPSAKQLLLARGF